MWGSYDLLSFYETLKYVIFDNIFENIPVFAAVAKGQSLTIFYQNYLFNSEPAILNLLQKSEKIQDKKVIQRILPLPVKNNKNTLKHKLRRCREEFPQGYSYTIVTCGCSITHNNNNENIKFLRNVQEEYELQNGFDLEESWS